MQRIPALTTALIGLSLLGPLWAQNRPSPTATPSTGSAANARPSATPNATPNARQVR